MAVADRFTAGFDAQVVQEWIADDPDPHSRAQLQALLDTATDAPAATGTDAPGTAPASSDPGTSAPSPAALAARAELEDRFAGPLVFGTAGLRGEIAAGPNRMNRAVVIRAAAGLSAFLAKSVGSDFSVVIGCDARYGSADFAHDTAAVVTAAGGRAIPLPLQLPTPVLAFALAHLGADAGVMVTASHNPPRDNGYKVYLGQRPLEAVLEQRGEDTAAARDGAGAQIVPPFDAMIAQEIAAVESVASVPRAEGWTQAGEEILTAYLERLGTLDKSNTTGTEARGDLRIVLTAMHGVGGQTALSALHNAGFSDIHVVSEQFGPDPDFPTVAFPNPEEPGALDLSFALAQQVGADLIIANDPDADRFSAAIPTPQGFRQLSGDEVGLLLGEHIASRFSASEQTSITLANSIVSSRALAGVAAAHGLEHRETLTGFKWISRVPNLVFGYEEALGYCVDPQAVRDKDGISAALTFAALASQLKARGLGIEDELARIRVRDGVRLTAPLSFRVNDLSLIAQAMASLRATPPTTLGGSAVTSVVDLNKGSDTLPPTDGIVLHTQLGDRVIVRPSGTEPKLKCYLETVGAVSSPDALPAATLEAQARLEAIRADLQASLGI